MYLWLVVLFNFICLIFIDGVFRRLIELFGWEFVGRFKVCFFKVVGNVGFVFFLMGIDNWFLERIVLRIG